jgi:hypothetical protein
MMATSSCAAEMISSDVDGNQSLDQAWQSLSFDE